MAAPKSRYWIIPNYYAPKWRSDVFSPEVNLHAVAYAACNFQCGFCNFRQRHLSGYIDFSDTNLFSKTVSELIELGRYFKFTGGEPTLNPLLERDLGIVKEAGGMVFLDTNGSRPDVLKHLFKVNLVDVLGLSLKASSAEQACKTTGLASPKGCWDNVWRSLDLAVDAGVESVVTSVFHSKVALSEVGKIAEMLSDYPGIRYKVNNLLINEFQGEGFSRHDSDELRQVVEKLVEDNPSWRGRITLVNSNDAVSDSSSVVFL